MHAVEGSLKAAKLPRVGSRLNASKPESELESGDAQYAEGGVQPEASASMTIVWGSSSAPSSRGRGSASSNSPPAVSQSFGDDKHLVGRHVRVREVLVPRVTECCFTTQIAPLDLGPAPLPEEEGPGTQPLTGGQDQYPRLSRVRESPPGRHVCSALLCSALHSPRAESKPSPPAVVLSQSLREAGWRFFSAADVLVFCSLPADMHRVRGVPKWQADSPQLSPCRGGHALGRRQRGPWRRRQEPGQRTAAAALPRCTPSEPAASDRSCGLAPAATHTKQPKDQSAQQRAGATGPTISHHGREKGVEATRELRADPRLPDRPAHGLHLQPCAAGTGAQRSTRCSTAPRSCRRAVPCQRQQSGAARGQA